MFSLKSTIARNSSSESDDLAAVKLALTALGYYDDAQSGLSPYADEQFFDSVKALQKDLDLQIDGVIKPHGPTQHEIRQKLKKRSGGRKRIYRFLEKL